jgi:dihydrofolate reductase
LAIADPRKEISMSIVRFQVAVSLDGFMAGPDQSVENPLGIGGEDLHNWMVELEVWRRAQGEDGGIVNVSTQVVEEAQANVGAYVMGRNMFGGGPGAWDDEQVWSGWWGEDPPYHTPVYVLTHHARDPLMMQGATTFHFVTDGSDAALARARDAAGGRDVAIAGGAKTIQQYLAAGAVDEFELHVVPLLLGSGERLLENVGDLHLEQVRAIEAPEVTHLKYRVLK